MRTLGLDAQGDDLALELAADLLEGTDVSHVTSPCCFEPRDHRGLDGDRLPEAIDAAPARGPERSGGWRRRDFLASRGMGEPGSPRGLPRGVESPGEESLTGAVAAQAIEAQPSYG